MKPSHKLTTSLRKVSRTELFTRLQVIRTLDPIVNNAYRRSENMRWKNNEDNSPHGDPWHVSFHASQFPGDNPMACGRAAMYQMADIPTEDFPDRTLRTIAQVGKAIEEELVWTMARVGLLISAKPSEETQTGFQLKEAWLTGSVDCVIKPPGQNKPLPIEIKTKYQKVIDQMMRGERGPDIKHVYQLKTQLGLVALAQKNGELWSDLEPVTHGFIYYLSRDKPSDTAEFLVELYERFFQKGVEKLKEWQESFLAGVLPSENATKKHPMGWRWSYEPCKWCKYKKICKIDFERGTTELSESVGISRAKKIRDDYNYEEARERVLDRWPTNEDQE